MNLREAGKQLIKANFGKAITEIIKPSSYRGNNPLSPRENYAIEVNRLFDLPTGFAHNYFNYSGLSSCLNAYEKCPPLQAILNRRASSLINGTLRILDAKKEDSKSKEAIAVENLLRNPNPYQTWSQFISQISITLDLVEYVVIFAIDHAAGYNFSDASSLWVCPPELCELKLSKNQLNYLNGGIDGIMIGNKTISFDSVMVITGINPSTQNLTIPNSKIKANQQIINNIIGAYESEGVIIDQRGPSGIISSKSDAKLGGTVPLLPNEIENIQNQFNQKYGLRKGQSSIVISDAAKELTYFKTGFDASELRLHESIEKGTRALCDGFGYYATMLGLEESKFSNLEQAEKALYLKHIIPHAKNITEQLTSYFFDKNTDCILLDYSKCPELQKDKKEEAEASKILTESLKQQFDLDLITQNQMLKSLGLPEIGIEGDKRKSQIPIGNVPLAVTLGVGGVQALTAILSAKDISDDARQAALEIVFGLKPADAARMSSSARVDNAINNQNTN